MTTDNSSIKNKISYPRLCDTCDHLANNPASWHYHKKTHYLPPLGKLCDFGCGGSAKFHSSTGVWRCSKQANGCPEQKNNISKRVSLDWRQTPERSKPGGIMDKFSVERRKEIGAKGAATKRIKLLAQDNTTDRRKYNRAVHSLSRYELKYNPSINPKNLKIARKQFHLDHMVSKHVGYLLGIPPEIIASPANLTIIEWKENVSKGLRCSKHPVDLLIQIGSPQHLIDQVQEAIAQLSNSFEQLLVRRNLPHGCA